ncbi:MAG: right-handed parallel beta-helix repeat-containing protein [Candidatus Pacearchaeota archaeon]
MKKKVIFRIFFLLALIISLSFILFLKNGQKEGYQTGKAIFSKDLIKRIKESSKNNSLIDYNKSYTINKSQEKFDRLNESKEKIENREGIIEYTRLIGFNDSNNINISKILFKRWNEYNEIMFLIERDEDYCSPKLCLEEGINVCGYLDDGCGGTINCGSCQSDYECNNNKCLPKNMTNIYSLRCEKEYEGYKIEYKSECSERPRCNITFLDKVHGGAERDKVIKKEKCEDNTTLNIIESIPSGAKRIEDCSYINSPGVYYLRKDIINATGYFNSRGNYTRGITSGCIYINGQNIILDCDNYMIEGEYSPTDEMYKVGLFIENSRNVKVKNCIISGWNNIGLKIKDSKDIVIENTKLINNLDAISIYTQNTYNLKLDNIDIKKSKNAIRTYQGENITLNNSRLIDNFNGVFSQLTKNLGIENSIIKNNYISNIIIMNQNELECKNSYLKNVFGDKNEPSFLYNNYRGKFQNKSFSDLIICGAKESSFENINISRSLVVTATKNSDFKKINSKDLTIFYSKDNIFSDMNINRFKNIIIIIENRSDITNRSSKYYYPPQIEEIYSGTPTAVNIQYYSKNNTIEKSFIYGSIFLHASEESIIKNNKIKGYYKGYPSSIYSTYFKDFVSEKGIYFILDLGNNLIEGNEIYGFIYNGIDFNTDIFSTKGGNIIKNNTIHSNIKNSALGLINVWTAGIKEISSNKVYSNVSSCINLPWRFWCSSKSHNMLVYNNLFNCNESIKVKDGSGTSYGMITGDGKNLEVCYTLLNINKISGKNIRGGNYLGGNYWAKPDGTGFSQKCPDNNRDGICDSEFNLWTYGGYSFGDKLPLK